jgi:integrase
VSAPKTDAGRRSVLLTPSAVSALRRHRTQQTEQRLRAVYWDDLDLVFCTSIGTHIQANNLLRRSWRPLLERAGLPAVRFHDLRHSCASLMLAEGVPVKVVAEMLGHADVSVTLKVYAHVSATMQADATAKMEALFSRAI